MVMWPSVSRADKPVITLGTINLPPYIIVNEDRTVTGELIERSRAILEQAGYELKVVILPWARALKEIKNCSIDAILPTMNIKSRQSFISYPDIPLTHFDVGIVASQRASRDVYDWQSLTNLSTEKDAHVPLLLMMRGFTSGQRFEELKNRQRFNIQYSSTMSVAMDMLAANRADYFLTIRPFSEQWLRQNKQVRGLELLPVILDKQAIHLAFCQNEKGRKLSQEVSAILRSTEQAASSNLLENN